MQLRDQRRRWEKTLLYFIEAATTGSGLLLAERAHLLGYDLCLVTTDIQKYDETPGRSVLDVLVERNRVRIENDLDSYRRPDWLDPSDHGSHGVFSGTDRHLAYASGLAEDLGAPYIRPGAVEVLRDKRRARELYRRIGLAQPAWADLPSRDAAAQFADSAGAPIVIKNVRGTGSLQVQLADSPDEAAAVWDLLMDESRYLDGDLMGEVFVDGPLVSLETLVSGGAPVFLGVTDRHLGPHPYFPELAYTFPAQVDLLHGRIMQEAVERIIAELGIEQGFLHTEFVLPPSGPVIVETNARLPGALVTRMLEDCLVDGFYNRAISAALGEPQPLPRFNGSYSSGVIIYADQLGLLATLPDWGQVQTLPWLKEVVPSAKVGQMVGSARDYRGSLGQVRTLAPSPSLSLAAAYAAAARLSYSLTTERGK